MEVRARKSLIIPFEVGKMSEKSPLGQIVSTTMFPRIMTLSQLIASQESPHFDRNI